MDVSEILAALKDPEPVAENEFPNNTTFIPREPTSLESAGLSSGDVEVLILKFLLNYNVATGRRITDQIKLPMALITEELRRLKNEQVVAYRRSVGVSDYDYELTPTGFERARRLFERSSYFGTAPVTLDDYIASIEAQSPTKEEPTADDLREALADLQVNPSIFSQLGQAITSVGAVFLYGSPGNGKTSMAERLTGAFGESIWIPRAVQVDGEIMRIFDPTVHVPMTDSSRMARVDERWVHIRRPTVMVGGELTLDSLEMRYDPKTGLLEAPIHLKSNCGTLVIDDLGRQRMSTPELLNRWIVPLEKRYDFLVTPSGKKIQVPFDQLLVFSTNLEPRELVDEAFLRRIPYKIEALDPTIEEFRKLFQRTTEKQDIAFNPEAFEHLISVHFEDANRQMRYCHVRDLVAQIKNYCRFHNQPTEMTIDTVDAAVHNYFAAL